MSTEAFVRRLTVLVTDVRTCARGFVAMRAKMLLAPSSDGATDATNRVRFSLYSVAYQCAAQKLVAACDALVSARSLVLLPETCAIETRMKHYVASLVAQTVVLNDSSIDAYVDFVCNSVYELQNALLKQPVTAMSRVLDLRLQMDQIDARRAKTTPVAAPVATPAAVVAAPVAASGTARASSPPRTHSPEVIQSFIEMWNNCVSKIHQPISAASPFRFVPAAPRARKSRFSAPHDRETVEAAMRIQTNK